MLFNSFKLNFENIGQLCKGINDKGINLEKNSFKVEQYLSAPNLRCIERIHGKQGLVALDKLHNDPLLVLPAIFKCLKGKPQDITDKLLIMTRNKPESMPKMITSHFVN